MIFQVDLATWLARLGQWSLSVDGAPAALGAPLQLPDGTTTVVLELRVRLPTTELGGPTHRALARVEVDVAGRPSVNVRLPALRTRGEPAAHVGLAIERRSTP